MVTRRTSRTYPTVLVTNILIDRSIFQDGQPDDTVYDPATGEDKTDPSLSDSGLSIPIDKVYGPDTEEGDHKDFSGLGYGISG